jgi:hypothetical protein
MFEDFESLGTIYIFLLLVTPNHSTEAFDRLRGLYGLPTDKQFLNSPWSGRIFGHFYCVFGARRKTCHLAFSVYPKNCGRGTFGDGREVCSSLESLRTHGWRRNCLQAYRDCVAVTIFFLSGSQRDGTSVFGNLEPLRSPLHTALKPRLRSNVFRGQIFLYFSSSSDHDFEIISGRWCSAIRNVSIVLECLWI